MPSQLSQTSPTTTVVEVQTQTPDYNEIIFRTINYEHNYKTLTASTKPFEPSSQHEYKMGKIVQTQQNHQATQTCSKRHWARNWEPAARQKTITARNWNPIPVTRPGRIFTPPSSSPTHGYKLQEIELIEESSRKREHGISSCRDNLTTDGDIDAWILRVEDRNSKETKRAKHDLETNYL